VCAAALVLGACTSDTPAGDADGGVVNPDGGGILPTGQGTLLPPTFCGPAGWCWDNPLPLGNDLEAVWAVADDDVWAVGSGRTFLHMDGKRWTQVETGSAFSPAALWGSSARDIWAAGSFPDGSTAMLHYDGANFHQVNTGLDFAPRTLWGSGPGDIWASGGISSMVAHYDGKAWTKVTTLPAAWISAFWGSGPRDVWTVGGNGVILHYDGSTWTTADTGGVRQNLNGIAGTSSSDVVAVGVEGLILHWDGKVWSRVQSPVSSELWWVAKVGGSLWIAGADGVVLRADGSGWKRLKTDSDLFLRGIAGASPSSLWVVGREGALLRYQPDSDEFVGGRHSSYSTLYSVLAMTPQDVWAVGAGAHLSDGMVLLHYDGKAWTRVDSADTARFFALWGQSSSDVWAVGSAADSTGIISHYDGTAWTPSATKPPTPLSSIHGSASDNVWAVGGSAVMHWDGKNWSTMSLGSGRLAAVYTRSARDVWVVGDEGLLQHYDGSGWTSFAQGAMDHLYAVRSFGPSDVWVAGENLPGNGRSYSVLLHYDGTAFTAAVPPVKYAGLYALYGSATDLWAGGNSGYLTHYDGKSWTPGYDRTPTNQDVHGLGGAGGVLWAVGTYGAILRHTNP
jgi:hypothetical protein